MKITKAQLKKLIKEEMEAQLPLPGMAIDLKKAKNDIVSDVSNVDPNVAMLSMFQYIDNLMDQNPDVEPSTFYKNKNFYERIYRPTLEVMVNSMFSFASVQTLEKVNQLLLNAIADFVKMDSSQRKEHVRKNTLRE